MTHRTRPANILQRARALAVRVSAKPSIKSIKAAQQEIAQIAWDARLAGDWHTWREVMRHLVSLKEQQQREGRKMDAETRAARLQVKNDAPAQITRLAQQRIQTDMHRLTPPQAQQLELERNLIRWRAEAVCEALWALASGDRTWEAVSTRSTLLPSHSSDVQMTGSTAGPQRLSIRVPELRAVGIEEHTVRLYRAQYEAVLDEWGYNSMRKVETLRARLNLAPGTKPSDAADELTRLAMNAYVKRPAVALAWANYLSSPRMPVIFVYELKSVRLAPRRSGDLRDCALELVNLLEVVADVRSQQLS